MIKLLVGITLVLLMSCSGKVENKTAATETSLSSPKEVDGVIIQPQKEADTLKGSTKAYATGQIGDAKITINYYSPAVRNRTIWGGLVAYNNVWVTGAHKATSIEFDKDIILGDARVEKGKYAIFTIPNNNEWTVIINKNWNQHLADDYNEAEDIARLSVVPVTNPTHQERLRYSINPQDNETGELVMQWEKIELRIPFSLVD